LTASVGCQINVKTVSPRQEDGENDEIVLQPKYHESATAASSSYRAFADRIDIAMAAPPPQTFPYDYLFKVLIIGDASVGKVGARSFGIGLPWRASFCVAVSMT
jgi:hypothetical protein